MPKFYLVVRGHERGTFGRNHFIDFCTRLRSLCKSKNVDLCIHVHTWSESEAKSSHRPLMRSRLRQISVDDVREYFKPVSDCVASVTVENDQDITLAGRTQGRLGGIPIVAWKRMWHGIDAAVSAALTDAEGDDADHPAMCIRIDNFSNVESIYHTEISLSKILEMIDALIKTPDDNIHFFKNRADVPGIDNCYGGRLGSIHRLTRSFHSDLDTVASRYPGIHHQEFMVFQEARRMGF